MSYYLQMPCLTAEDVVDFIEAIDLNHDGLIQYNEFMETVEPQHELLSSVHMTDHHQHIQMDTECSGASQIILQKVTPYGAEEIRDILFRRKLHKQAMILEEREKNKLIKKIENK